MKIAPFLIALQGSLALSLAACSPAASDESAAPADSAPAVDVTATPTPSPTSDAAEGAANTLRLDGLGDLTVGDDVPAGSSFAERGAQIPGSECHTISSPEYPGVYAITEGGEVRRISVSGDSPVKLVEGIGPGSTEKEVLAAFPGFVSSGHAYVEPPAKYLTQPGDDPRLMFEIGADGKVSAMHVGLLPQLTYVEGCA